MSVAPDFGSGAKLSAKGVKGNSGRREDWSCGESIFGAVATCPSGTLRSDENIGSLGPAIPLLRIKVGDRGAMPGMFEAGACG